MGQPFLRHAHSHLRIPRRRSRLLSIAASSAALLAALFSALPARAYDALAEPCDLEATTCQSALIAFSRKDALPIEFSFDTGWTPPNSPLQVHLWAGLYASTQVSLAGSFEAEWPKAFAVRTPGAPKGGHFGYHYGVEVGAEGKVEIEVGGQKYSWTGDLPYIPQFDFQVEAASGFDAWGFPPGVTIASKTQEQTLAQIGIADIIGGSIPGIDGGFQLDVAMELEATYATDRIVITTTDGKPIKGGAIETDDGESSMEYLGGPSVEVDVHPEGTVDYNGVLHLIPAFFVEVLGQSWSIPIADIPVAFPITKNDWVFDNQRVHVPLPDLVLPEEEINFGDVEVGQKNLEPVALFNAGEAKIVAAVVSSNPDAFEVYDPSVEIDPNATFDTAVRFVPKKNGEFKATIYVGSNDPSDPVQAIMVRGVGYGGPDDAAAQTDPAQDSGCSCRVAGAEGGGASSALAPFGVIAAAGALSMLRRRTRRR